MNYFRKYHSYVVGKQQCTTFGNYKCTKMVSTSAPLWYYECTKMVIV